MLRLILALLLGSAFAFNPGLSRRDAFVKGGVAFFAGVVAPEVASAFRQQLDDYAVEPSQQATGGKLDLNNAPIGEYKFLRGMYPHAAGKIASNGPYKSVRDMYRLEGLTTSDKKLFMQHEREFAVNPPGRTFKERINDRVST